MPPRKLPVVPDLTQLRHQAKDLLRAARTGDPDALADFAQFHPERIDPAHAKLADAQLVLARSYQAPSWPRLVLACQLVDAIWQDDVRAVKALLVAHPDLIREPVLIRGDSNWGPPLAYAANVGRDTIIKVIHALDPEREIVMDGLGRAVLQGRIETARMLHRMAGLPTPPDDALGGPAYTQSVAGTAFLFEIGARAVDEHGTLLAPVAVVLESDSRKPEARHEILEMYVRHGAVLPDTPMMALHRGRLDLLEDHLRRDPGLLTRTFTWAEIFPPDVGCRQLPPGEFDFELMRTPIDGGTLLHVAVEFDEMDVARWLLDKGMDPDTPAAVDAAGFGGHTALFGAVVSYPHFWSNYGPQWAHSRKPKNARFAELLLRHGANPNARASLRENATVRGKRRYIEHRDVTPLAWGERHRDRLVVSEVALAVLREHGGHV